MQLWVEAITASITALVGAVATPLVKDWIARGRPRPQGWLLFVPIGLVLGGAFGLILVLVIIETVLPEPTVDITTSAAQVTKPGCEDIRGGSSHLAAEEEIWLVVVPSKGRFHPQVGPAIELGKGEWSALACFGGAGVSDVLAVVPATQGARDGFRIYKEACQKTGDCPSVEELWEGTVVRDRLEVSVVQPPQAPAQPPAEILLEGEAGTGRVMPRSRASDQRTVLLKRGESRILVIQVPAQARYQLSVRYSNDNSGELEMVNVSVDGAPAGQFRAKDTGSSGRGWNAFATSTVGPVDLAPGVHELTLTVSGGDGLGVEIDMVRLQ